MSDGHRPSTRERLLIESTDTLAPHQSLDRIDKSSATVTTAVTLAGTLAGGFGAIAASRLTDVGIGYALPTVVLAAISIACAVLATVPSPGKVAPGNLVAVEEFFREQLQHRGRLVRVAAWALAVAVVLAPLPLVAAALEGDDPTLDLSTSVTGKERKLVVGLAGRELDPDAVVTLRVERSGKTLAVATADAASDGKLKAAITVLSVPAGSQLTVKASGAAESPSRTQTVEVPQVVE